jgi:hypothetical protein
MTTITTNLDKLTDAERGAYLAQMNYLQSVDKINQLKKRRAVFLSAYCFSEREDERGLIEQALTKNTSELSEFEKQGFAVWGN